MSEETVEVRREGRVGVLKFNRPQSLNAFSSALVGATNAAVAELTADPAVRVILVHGAGRAFSAGFDLKEGVARGTRGVEAWRAVLEADFDFIMQFWDCPKPTVAAVHGYCLAGAFELALACDVTVAGEGTRFGEPEVRFGSGIVALLLPWFTGPKLAKEMLLTGDDTLSARRMLEAGLVNRVVADDQVLATATELARALASAAPESVRLTKRAINRSYEIMGLRQALLAALETDICIEAGENPDRLEFNRIRKEQGLAAALAWRNSR
jgi:enoyl-CoA hydratase